MAAIKKIKSFSEKRFNRYLSRLKFAYQLVHEKEMVAKFIYLGKNKVELKGADGKNHLMPLDRMGKHAAAIEQAAPINFKRFKTVLKALLVATVPISESDFNEYYSTFKSSGLSPNYKDLRDLIDWANFHFHSFNLTSQDYMLKKRMSQMDKTIIQQQNSK